MRERENEREREKVRIDCEPPKDQKKERWPHQKAGLTRKLGNLSNFFVFPVSF